MTFLAQHLVRQKAILAVDDSTESAKAPDHDGVDAAPAVGHQQIRPQLSQHSRQTFRRASPTRQSRDSFDHTIAGANPMGAAEVVADRKNRVAESVGSGVDDNRRSNLRPAVAECWKDVAEV